MGRVLVLLAIVVGLVWWVSSRVRGAKRSARRPDATSDGTPPVRDMIACAHCGVHLPRDEAVVEGERLFCGDAHRRLGPRAE